MSQPKPQFCVLVGFYVEAENEEDARRVVAERYSGFDPDINDYPEAWTITPHDPEG